MRSRTLAWQAEALRVSREVLRALAAALGQDEVYRVLVEFITDHVES